MKVGRERRRRATNAQRAVRCCQVIHLRIAGARSAREIAVALGVTPRTIQRDLAALRDGRPSPATRMSVTEYVYFYDEYLDILTQAVGLGTEALKANGLNSPMRLACEQLTADTQAAVRTFRQSVAGEDAPRATGDDLRPNAHLDIVKRFDRTREFYDAPPKLVDDVREALVEFGPRDLMPRRMGRIERELRMALACFATEMKRDEIAAAFDCSGKTVTRTKSRALAREPRLEKWGAQIKSAVIALERDYAMIAIKTSANGATLTDLAQRKALLDRLTEAHILLGTLHNGPKERYDDRRETLLEAVHKAGRKHRIPPEDRDHMVLLATAWADHKPLPGGRPPLPPKPRPRQSDRNGEGYDTNH